MDDKELIECVRQYKVLYDPSQPKYMDINFKSDIWNIIGRQLKTDGSVCKIRWNNIRDTYRKSFKKSLKSGLRVKNMKRYKYADQLIFLNKYFTEKETDTTESSENMKIEGSVLDQNLGRENIVSEVDVYPLLHSTSHKKESSFHVPRQKPSTNNVIPQPNSAAKLRDYYKNESQNSDQVDAFLGGLAPTLKTFSPYILHLAKSEIFAVVQKYELKTILGDVHPEN